MLHCINASLHNKIKKIFFGIIKLDSNYCISIFVQYRVYIFLMFKHGFSIMKIFPTNFTTNGNWAMFIFHMLLPISSQETFSHKFDKFPLVLSIHGSKFFRDSSVDGNIHHTFYTLSDHSGARFIKRRTTRRKTSLVVTLRLFKSRKETKLCFIKRRKCTTD